MTTVIPGTLTIAAGTLTPSNLVLSPVALCPPNDPDNYPGNTEICDGKDNNCNGQIDEGIDSDGDGYTAIGSCSGSADDCNDNDKLTHPGATEICGDGKDNNCNGQIDEGIDADGDGYTAIGSCSGSANDCNDTNGSIHPGATEIFGDGIDQDCDGQDSVAPIDSACTDCHDASNLNYYHGLVTAPDSTCATCHTSIVGNVMNGHYGRKVRTSGNNMPAGSLIGCTSCHDWHDIRNFDTGVYTNFVWAKVGTALNLTCDTCHEDRAAVHATGTAHTNRTIDSSCPQCHTSDTSVLGSPGTGTLASAGDVDTLHRSDCTLCHAYSGTKLDAALVRQAIQAGLNGTQTACTACHTTHHSGTADTISYNASVDTSYPSQQGCADCHHDYDKTNGTSLGLSSWEAILVEHDMDGSKDGSSNSCATCHAYDGNGSPSLTVVRNTIAGGNPATCTTCHTDKAPNVEHGVPTSGKHSQHLAMAGVGCSTCHNTSNFPAFKSGTDLNGDHLYSLAETDICSNCHSNGAGGVPNRTDYKAVWADPGVNFSCADCHGNPPNTGAHLVHASVAALTYGSDSNNSVPVTYGFNCGNCHSLNQARHANGIIDIELYDASATGLKRNNPSTASRTGTGTATVCNNVYCHSDGREAVVRTYRSTPAWGGSFTGNKCAGCHNDPPQYDNGGPGSATANSHLAHIGAVGIHTNDIYAGFQEGLLPGSGPQGSGAAHGDPATSTTMSCNLCHASTVDWTDKSQFSTKSGSGTATGCDVCHDGSTAFANPTAVITNKANHVNGTRDLAFIPRAINVKAQLQASTFDQWYGPAGWTRNTYKAATDSHDSIDLSTAGSYSPDKKSCTVACHWGSVPWGTTNLTCASCHTEL